MVGSENLNEQLAKGALLDELAWIIVCRKGIPSGVNLFRLNCMMVLPDINGETTFDDDSCGALIEKFYFAKAILAGATRKDHVWNREPLRDNLRGTLLHFYSHLSDEFINDEFPPDTTCNHCIQRFNAQRYETVRKKIKHGTNLGQIRNPSDVKDFLGTHLTIKDISKLLGRKVNHGHQIGYLRETANSIDYRALCHQMIRELMSS